MKALFRITLIILIYMTIATSLFDFWFNTGTGSQAGIISEVEKTGIFWKPPIVHLLNIKTTFSQEDTSYWFGASQEMATLAEYYLKNNTKVEVYYETKMFVWRWKYSSRTIITDIKPLQIEK